MVNLFKRMRTLKTILNIRTGLGAAILPSTTSATKEFPAISRLHLTYARKINGGHQGARHFWRQALTRLKYHNPGIPMTVKQTEEQAGPCALTIYYAGDKVSNAASTLLHPKTPIDDKYAPAAADAEKTAVLDMKDLRVQEIWDKVKMVTGAAEVEPTQAESAELNKLELMEQKSGADRQRIQKIRQAKRDQERMLQEARGEVEKLKAL